VPPLADAFAGRVRGRADPGVAAQVSLALARDPDPAERRLSEALAVDHGLEALCRSLFNLGEFVVID